LQIGGVPLPDPVLPLACVDCSVEGERMRRERQIALTGRAVKALGHFGTGRAFLRAFQTSPLTGPAYRAALGYRRPFPSLAEAREALAHYGPLQAQGHDSLANVRHHLELSSHARPSDYAALFHMTSLLPRLSSVFDLGGNAGNLFYCYSRYLRFPEDLAWTVLDLPGNMEAGKEIARERGVRALRFASRWQEAAGADLLLISGALHYLERPLPEMLEDLASKPAYILLNRTPLVDGPQTAAVQTASGFRLPCMLYNRQKLLSDLGAQGYAVLDEWKAAELSMEIPGYPEYNVPAYSGAFLRRADLACL
jgi:putative methyltransferase (TIGR04325 family)